MSAGATETAMQTAPVKRRVEADGLQWSYVEKGEGPCVLLVHGTAASVHSWRHIFPLLAPSYHVIAVDLPGHGDSQARGSSDYRLPRMARGVGAVMAKLGAAPQIVAGHSAGAAVLAEAMAGNFLSAQTLVSFNGAFFPFGGALGSLFSPVAKLMALNPFLPRILSGVASRKTVERLLRDTGSSPSPEDVDMYLELFARPSHVAAALGMMAAWDLGGMQKSLNRLVAKCVFVAGDNDKAVPPNTSDRAAAHCKDAKTLHYAGYGHLLHEENPRLAADIIGGRVS